MAFLQNRAIDIINFEKYYLNSTEDTQNYDRKYNVGLKTLLQQGLSEPVIMTIWSIHSKESLESFLFMISLKRPSNIIKESDVNVMRPTACLVIN